MGGLVPEVVCIVQARMGSTRLPGKSLMSLHGRPMLLRQLERLVRCSSVHRLVVATSREQGDDELESVVHDSELASVSRGPLNDVLGRYLQAAEENSAEVVVRVSGDCPLIDPTVVDRCVQAYLQHRQTTDYVSNTRKRTFARGLDTEVFPLHVLARAAAEASEPFEREHVTPYIWQHPEKWRLVDVTAESDHSYLRLTVDTLEDLELVRRIYELLYPVNRDFGYQDVLAVMESQPDLRMINSHVEQKPVRG